MPIEGHGMDCDCGCCEEEGVRATSLQTCRCPSCGKEIANEMGASCSEIKCPSCGTAMKPGPR